MYVYWQPESYVPSVGVGIAAVWRPGWTYVRMVPSLRAVPHLSHLVGLASPQMSNLSARGGHVVGVLGQVSPIPTVGSGKYKYKCVCVCVCVCPCTYTVCVYFQQYYILIEYPILIMFTVEHNRYTKFILSKDILTTRANIDMLLDIHSALAPEKCSEFRNIPVWNLSEHPNGSVESGMSKPEKCRVVNMCVRARARARVCVCVCV